MKKGNQWYFGMKAHSVDSRTKLIWWPPRRPMCMTLSCFDLLHGGETRVWGDSAYAGQREVIREHAPNARDFTHKKGCRNRPLSDDEKAKNRTKSKVRAKGEHPFLISNEFLVSTRYVTGGWTKMPTACLWPADWSICSWPEKCCCGQHRGVRLKSAIDTKNQPANLPGLSAVSVFEQQLKCHCQHL